ncbi:MAG: CAP domain-containing protein [Candidatus Dormibacteria bacterium]
MSPQHASSPSASDTRWEALCRTAIEVRAERAPRRARRPRARGLVLAAGALLGVALFAATHFDVQPVGADAGADSDLFALTNQDRSSNGVAALADNSTLGAIGEAAPYSGCSGAGTVDGRAQDMINRDYFSHQIPPCNEYVWPMMSAFGVHYRSAGENIGWESGYGSGSSSASQVNTDFMNSPDHRTNILNPNFTDLGVGSATAASGWSYSSTSGTFSDVWMFAEEFAQLGSPAPPPTAPPARSSAPASTQPAPSTPTPTPSPTASPTPSPSPSAAPTPSPTPAAPLPAYEPGGAYSGPELIAINGLISETIESTLEAFLFN